MHALLQTMVVAQRCEFNALFVTLSIPIGYFLCITEHLFVSTGLTSNRSSCTNRELHYYFGISVSLLFEISSCFYYVWRAGTVISLRARTVTCCFNRLFRVTACSFNVVGAIPPLFSEIQFIETFLLLTDIQRI